jgi:hypothetical protein
MPLHRGIQSPDSLQAPKPMHGAMGHGELGMLVLMQDGARSFAHASGEETNEAHAAP